LSERDSPDCEHKVNKHDHLHTYTHTWTNTHRHIHVYIRWDSVHHSQKQQLTIWNKLDCASVFLLNEDETAAVL